MPALQEWLDSRQPAAPEALRRRIGALVADHPEWETMPPAHAMLIASGMLMAGVLSASPKCRDAAVDLLAADACVTYGFEAAADAPDAFTFLADQSMISIARLVERA